MLANDDPPGVLADVYAESSDFTAAIWVSTGQAGHQPGAEGLIIAEQPDGRIRVEPARIDPSAPWTDAQRTRLERLRCRYRQALGRSRVVQEVDGLAYVLAPESLP
jgi:hypothetical protein